MNYTSIITEAGKFLETCGQNIVWTITAALAAAVVVILLCTAVAILEELPRAIRETRERQREWHPDPEAEREEVAEIQRRKARAEWYRIHKRLDFERRQAIQEAAARREKYQAIARRKEAARAAKADQAAGVQ